MSPRLVELALKKQRLQIRSAALRADFSSHAAAWRPVFAIADQGQAALLWLRRHPAVPVAVLVALLVARPRVLLRWLKRGFFAWQALAKLREVVSVQSPIARSSSSQ